MTNLARARLLSILALTVAACGGAVSPTAVPATGSGASPATSPGASAAAASAAASPAGTPRATPVPVATGAPLGDELVATIKVSNAPCALATDGTSAYVTSNSSGAIDKVDPATDQVVGHAIIGVGPCGIALGSDGRMWIADLGKSAVLAVDPATLKVTATIEGLGNALWDLKAGFGSVWVADRTNKVLLRIDPAKAKVVASIPIGPRAAGLAVMKDGVWVADEVDYQLRRIDPATNKVAAMIKGAGAPTWFSDDGNTTLLIGERGLSKVAIVDVTAGALVHETTGWNEPLDGTVFAGKAWVPDGSGKRLGVIDLANPDAPPVRYALPDATNPFVAEPAFGDVWVLDYSGTTVWRIKP
ncbi:MAG TPA: YncE family protein [Candidatus Limnocylindrales bacterium]|nr:YncE family protein [Candidatus Limnocylindrales bacterium]